MKIGTVTWITYRNYGTVLQAYALQQAVAQLGFENEILSDREILKEFRKTHPYPQKTATVPCAVKQSSAKKLLQLLRRPRTILRSITARFFPAHYRQPYEGSQIAITAFVQEELRIRQGVTPQALNALNADYDAFVCGSDQVWSVFPINFNPYYYLDFAEKPKISYAPSLGTDRLTPEISAELKRLLSGFHAISVRERKSAEQLSLLLNREVSWVADPTLLHARTFWQDFTKSVSAPRKKYLLCYFLEARAWYYDYAKKLAQKLRLKILLLPNLWDHLNRVDVDQNPIGPKEFVSRFRDASYVLTDSFHGSIFSLIFNKDFLYLQRFENDDSSSQNIRIDSLFGYLCLEGRIVSKETPEIPPVRIDNYPQIQEKLETLRNASMRFLSESLSGIQEKTR